MPIRYIPLLRSKAGEVAALENLAAQAKARLMPLIHVSEKPPATFAQNTPQAWAGLPMALDGLFNFGTTGLPRDFTTMFHALGRGNVPVIPAVECDAPAPYTTIVHGLVNRYSPGVLVKATIGQLPMLGAWVAAQNWRENDIDLVVSAGHVGAYGDAQQFYAFVIQAIRNAIPLPSPWRSVTLASAAAPRDYSGFALGRTNVPRLDWQLWSHIHGQMPFQLDYGDYGVAHPDLTEPPGVAMTRASVSVRYAIDNEWIILKGRPTTGQHGRPMGQTFYGHARTLTHDPQFGGIAGCWGDQRIQQISTGGGVGAGNRTTWVGLNLNRHLSLVADRLP